MCRDIIGRWNLFNTFFIISNIFWQHLNNNPVKETAKCHVLSATTVSTNYFAQIYHNITFSEKGTLKHICIHISNSVLRQIIKTILVSLSIVFTSGQEAWERTNVDLYLPLPLVEPCLPFLSYAMRKNMWEELM